MYNYCPHCGHPLHNYPTFGPQPYQPKQYPEFWCSTNTTSKEKK